MVEAGGGGGGGGAGGGSGSGPVCWAPESHEPMPEEEWPPLEDEAVLVLDLKKIYML